MCVSFDYLIYTIGFFGEYRDRVSVFVCDIEFVIVFATSSL